MKIYAEYFHTEEAAWAFCRGVELVGTSEVVPCGPKLQEGFEDGEENAWAVAVHDGRKIMGRDVCPSCGVFDSVEGSPDGPDHSVVVEAPSLHECDNCGEQWGKDAVNEIQGYFQRVAAGGVVPSGECPMCGALCYPVKGGA